ncbi:MAG: B12-binding domain-containing radical SAM protein [Nanoarchaeota archaeon]|nr:B12-binding domain-containing radical SAM protein [Nanoarchaeota archaeon]
MELLMITPRFSFTDKKDYRYFTPLSLAYISASLKKAGYKLDYLNLNHNDGLVREILHKAFDKKKYDYILTGTIAYGYGHLEKIIAAAKSHRTNPKIILGGPLISSEPKLIFDDLKADFAVIGEGEETIVELLDCLEKKGDLSKVKGLVFKEDKTIFTGTRKPIQNLDALPFPDYRSFEYEEYLNNVPCNLHHTTHFFDFPRPYYLLASRSCPFHCTFCYHDTEFRERTINNIMKEIKSVVKKYKINVLIIHAECFSLDMKRLKDFCKKIKKYREELDWDLRWIVQMSVLRVNGDVLKMMRDSGCLVLSYGFESMSPEVLKSMRKPITPKLIEDAFFKTLELKMGVVGNFIFGDVAETKETAKETLDWWKKNAKGQIGLGFIQPYPNSEIYRHCLKKRIITDKLDFIKNKIHRDHWLNITDNMTDKEIKQLRTEVLDAMGNYCKYITPKSVKHRKNKRYDFKVDCPFCKEPLEYKNCEIYSRWDYGFFTLCRHCLKRFFIVSPIQKLGYRYYSKLQGLRELKKRIKEILYKKIET